MSAGGAASANTPSCASIYLLLLQIVQAVDAMDCGKDEAMVVERLKTGEVPPPDIQVTFSCS